MRRAGWLLVLLIPMTARAGLFVGEGGTGSSFLKVPTMARGASLAGAFTAVRADVNALEYNPAGLVGVNRTDITASYIDYLEDTTLQSLSVAFPWQLSEPKPGEELSSEGKIFMGLQYRTFQAKDTARNDVGVSLGNFNIRDQLLQLDMAVAPSDRLSLGLGGKYIGHKLQNESANNYALDAGINYWLTGPWTVGVSMLNIGPDTKFISQGDPLPTVLKTGGGYQGEKSLLLGDISVGRDSVVQESLAIEYQLSRHVSLRGGTFHYTSLEFTGGIGVNFAGPSKSALGATPRRGKNTVGQPGTTYQPNLDFGLDYAMRTSKDLGLTHIVSLKILY